MVDMSAKDADTIETQTKKNRRNIDQNAWLKYIKYISLLVLIIQNAGQVLLIRHATTRHQKPFLKTVLVFFSEVLKCAVACLLLWASHGSLNRTLIDLRVHFWDNFLDTLKVGVPAFIYTVQNFLLYVSIENLDAGTYMVTYQLKILTTALFTVLMLKRRLSVIQWISLLILCAGVATVQISAKKQATNKPTEPLLDPINGNMSLTNQAMPSTGTPLFNVTLPPRAKLAEKPHHNQILGLSTVMMACFLSGFAGIYFEKILKGSDASIWLRNVQLAALSIPIGMCLIAFSNLRDVLDSGLLQGFDLTVWVCVVVQALGGLIVAVVIKYADNILKAFATSFAIIVSSTASILLFHHYPTLLFNGGAALVILAVFLYSVFPPRSKSDRPPKDEYAALERLGDGEPHSKRHDEDFIEVEEPIKPQVDLSAGIATTHPALPFNNAKSSNT